MFAKYSGIYSYGYSCSKRRGDWDLKWNVSQARRSRYEKIKTLLVLLYFILFQNTFYFSLATLGLHCFVWSFSSYLRVLPFTSDFDCFDSSHFIIVFEVSLCLRWTNKDFFCLFWPLSSDPWLPWELSWSDSQPSFLSGLPASRIWVGKRRWLPS